jgi:hypothetical protein
MSGKASRQNHGFDAAARMTDLATCADGVSSIVTGSGGAFKGDK